MVRIGVGTPLGYKENAFFEAAGHIIRVCYAVRNGPNLPELIMQMREAVLKKLTGT